MQKQAATPLNQRFLSEAVNRVIENRQPKKHREKSRPASRLKLSTDIRIDFVLTKLRFL